MSLAELVESIFCSYTNLLLLVISMYLGYVKWSVYFFSEWLAIPRVNVLHLNTVNCS